MSEDSKLSQEQIKNWRKIIPIAYGIPSNLLSDDEIQKLRDKLQSEINLHA